MATQTEKWLLLIEDSEDIQCLLSGFLISSGYHVQCANNGREALDLLDHSDTCPHLILLDLMMPEMDGFQFSDEIKKTPRLSQIPIVVMTADGAVDKKTQSLPIQGYLKKPFSNLEAILEKVGKFF